MSSCKHLVFLISLALKDGVVKDQGKYDELIKSKIVFREMAEHA
jgi:hypothetical protein